MVLNKTLSVIGSVALIIVLLVSSVELVVYGNKNYFEHEYTKYNVNESVNMTIDDLLYVTDQMMLYLKDGREDLNILTTINGENREFFNDKEKAHMSDVKMLFLQAILIRRVAVVITIAVFGFALYKKILPLLCRFFIWVCSISAVIIGVLAVVVASDFNKYFTMFHEIFFTNDLWILDPAVDLLINIVPLPFFMDTAFSITAVFAIMLAILLIASFVIIKINKKI